MMRYLPAKGTAGFARCWVSGRSRSPRPPARIMVKTSRMVHTFSGDWCCDVWLENPNPKFGKSIDGDDDEDSQGTILLNDAWLHS